MTAPIRPFDIGPDTMLAGFTCRELLDLRGALAERNLTLADLIADLRGLRRLTTLPRWSPEEIAMGNAAMRAFLSNRQDEATDT